MNSNSYIETMHQLSSRRGYEERSVTTEHQTSCHPEGGTTERSVALQQHRNRFPAYRFTSRLGWQAGSSLFGMTDKFANCRFKLPGDANNLPIDAFKLPIVGLNCRFLRLVCQLSHLNCQLSAQTANGKLRLPGDGSNSSVGTKNCPGTAQPSRWEQKTARGRLNLTWGAVDMRVLVLSVSNTSRTERHLKVSQAMAIQPLGVFKTLKVSETEHSSVISTKDEERSVTTELCSNRFPAYRQAGSSLFGMTEEKGENFTPRFGLTPYNGACGLNCPPTGRGTSGAGGFEEDPAEVGGYKLATCNLDLAASFSTIKNNNSPSRRIAGTTKNAHLSVLKTMGTGDNNLFPFLLISNSEEQVSGLVKMFEMNYCSKGNRPPLSPEGGNSLPFGEVRRGQFPMFRIVSNTGFDHLYLQGQSGIVANTNKTSAYET